MVCVQAFKALQGLIMSVVLTAVDDKHANPVWPGMGYPGQMLPNPLSYMQPTLIVVPRVFTQCYESLKTKCTLQTS